VDTLADEVPIPISFQEYIKVSTKVKMMKVTKAFKFSLPRQWFVTHSGGCGGPGYKDVRNDNWWVTSMYSGYRQSLPVRRCLEIVHLYWNYT